MSASTLPISTAQPRPRLRDLGAAISPADYVTGVMRAFASLKLTVALFALGIFIVLVGTLAQQEANIGQVVRHYFHAWLMWVDVNLLFPKAFFQFTLHDQVWSMPHIPL